MQLPVGEFTGVEDVGRICDLLAFLRRQGPEVADRLERQAT